MVNVIPTEDSDRLELSGNYLMTVRKEYLCLHSAKTGERVFQWELDHLPRFQPEIMPSPYYPFMSLTGRGRYFFPLEPKKQRSKK